MKIHWINKDWKMCEKLLDFVHLEGSHTGSALCTQLKSSLDAFDIPLSKFLGCTMDNAFNNDAFMTELSKLPVEKDDTITNVSNHVRCLPHILNLVVEAFLKALKVQPDKNEKEEKEYESLVLDEQIEDKTSSNIDSFDEENSHDVELDLESSSDKTVSIVKKLRLLVRKIRRSPQLRQSLRDQCLLHKIKALMAIIDVETRWNSTYHMMQRAKFLKVPLLALCSSKTSLNKLIIKEEEWSVLNGIEGLLSKFDNATKKSSLSKTPTISSYVPLFDWLLQSIIKFRVDNDGMLSEAGKLAQQKLMKYKPSIDRCEIPFISTVLDPTLHLNYFKEREYGSDEIKKIKDKFSKLFRLYKKKVPGHSPTTDDDDEEENVDEFLAFKSKRSKSDKVDSELQEYLKLKLPATKTDILSWWKANEHTFPVISRIARDYLAVQGSSVCIEREFSGGADLVSPTRCSMHGGTISMCMCLKSWGIDSE